MTQVLKATAENVKEVLDLAQGGDIVHLVGEFAMLLLTQRTFQPSLIVDASAATLAAVVLRSVSGVRWMGGMLRPKDGRTAFAVAKSSKVRIENLAFESDGLHHAVYVQESQDVAFINCRLEKARSGITLRDVDGFLIEGLMVWRWSANGVSLESARHGLITQSSFVSRMKLDGIHPDAIQGLFSKDIPNHHIEIVENYVGGEDTQGIFFNRALPGYLQHHHIRIVDNMVCTATAPNGITNLGDPAGEVIGNRVSTLPGSRWQTKINTDVPVRKGNRVAAYERWPEVIDK